MGSTAFAVPQHVRGNIPRWRRIYSAFKYRRLDGARLGVIRNVYIAVGTMLPGFGGAATRFGYTEALYATELIGLLFVWRGYRSIVRSNTASLRTAQRAFEQRNRESVTSMKSVRIVTDSR
jgi:hypothetical protein